MNITGLRILPPLAIGRLGSAKEPMVNFTLADDPENPLDFRTLQAAETFVIDEKSGEITKKFFPKKISFKETRGKKEHIRPVAPFLEVFAITEQNELVPLTVELLATWGLQPNDVQWKVEVANRKVSRRTGDPGDSVEANTGWFSNHAVQELAGKCPHFTKSTDSLPFGKVRYIKPNEAFPEIRLRFTPAAGHIYGPYLTESEKKADRESQAATDLQARGVKLYEIEKGKDIYDTKRGKWYGFSAPLKLDNEDPTYHGDFYKETFPSSLFSIKPPAPCWLNGNVAVSRGYLDDACDGVVSVRIQPPGSKKAFEASARITASPPAIVPDTLFLRTLADDLDQVIYGPRIPVTESEEETRARAIDIIRRAFETVRFLNVAVMNGNPVKGRDPLLFDTMPAEEAYDTERLMRPVVPKRTADTLMIQALHQQVFAALRGGAAPWFLRMLRMPDQVGDFTDHGRRKMPAMMCGADGNYLALTWRQINTIFKAAQLGAGSPGKVELETSRTEDLWGTELTPRNLSAQMLYAAKGNPVSSRPTTSVGNCTPGLEVDFRAVWRRIFQGIELREWDNLVVDAEEPYRALIGHRLLRVNGQLMMTQMYGPSPAGVDTDTTLLATDWNPSGVAPLEWSNALASILHENQGKTVQCDFTKQPVGVRQAWWDDHKDHPITHELTVRPFFEAKTAMISKELARPGELTQGLCSPWQNDYRECSCYYWASARPDYVNVEPTPSGASRGDNWMQKQRTGDYVADDYEDMRLLAYDELFEAWESWLRFQVKGRDASSEGVDLQPPPKGEPPRSKQRVGQKLPK